MIGSSIPGEAILSGLWSPLIVVFPSNKENEVAAEDVPAWLSEVAWDLVLISLGPDSPHRP